MACKVFAAKNRVQVREGVLPVFFNVLLQRISEVSLISVIFLFASRKLELLQKHRYEFLIPSLCWSDGKNYQAGMKIMLSVKKQIFLDLLAKRKTPGIL